MKQKENNLEIKRHSCSHLLAAAIAEIYPKTKFGIGPSIENGFYYDFDFEKPINEEDLSKISKKMIEIAKKKIPFQKEELAVNEAEKLFKNQPYKLELIADLKKDRLKKVSVYKLGNFVDLCTGPHIENSSQTDSFKLLSLAGAYWRGSEKNKMLTRIYGVCFDSQKDLNDHLRIIEELKKRDHKKLGPQLEIFFLHPTAPGMPYWLPKGVTIINQLIDFWRTEHNKRGYQEIKSPLINKKELYVSSGHWQHYQEEMFISKTKEKETYALKPMNCPNAMVVFQSKLRSYKDLPLRIADIDTLHRNERSGTLNGLFRVREFSQDDAHIFLTEEQIISEYKKILEITELFYSIFSLSYSLRLGTRPKKFMGDKESWDKAEKELEKILKESGKDYSVLEGDGAFYGPKIDILMKDSLGREWQMGTIQLDFQIPKKFKVKYIDKNGKAKTPVVIHRVIYGSLERFMGILIEHYNGAFPVWLSPTQVIILPISDKQNNYAKKIKEELNENDIRNEFDNSNQTIGAKIRNAQLNKIPYMIIVGEKEAKQDVINLRTRNQEVLGEMKMDKFLNLIKEDIANKRQI